MNRLPLQLLAFSTFLINHACNLLFTVEAFTATRKIAFGVLALVFIMIFVGDYFLNYKKKGAFKLSVTIYSALPIPMWLIDGFYWVVALNVLLFIAFLRAESQLKLKEEQS
jgi:hypothetical protein